MSPPNPFILASDASPHLLPLLRSNPSLATTQDPTGYSLLHALSSYSHPTLLLTLHREFHLNPTTLLDSDGETALFAAESVAVARVLVEEMGCDISVRNREGETAEEKIRGEGEFVGVADYLGGVRRKKEGSTGEEEGGEKGEEGEGRGGEGPLPRLPPNVTVNMGVAEEEEEEVVADPAFRARIEELAAREDFRDEEGQRRLKELVTEAVRGVERDVGAEGRDVRRRV
ncbi:MAG: hypothetical protein LQ344_004093 [Seirophora lacunosa]|nr:MAG: hypothetical protein LQ344_004093 [Seirophora lacunosa]